MPSKEITTEMFDQMTSELLEGKTLRFGRHSWQTIDASDMTEWMLETESSALDDLLTAVANKENVIKAAEKIAREAAEALVTKYAADIVRYYS